MHATRNQNAAMGYLIDEHADHLRSAGCSQATVHSRIRLLRCLHDYLDDGLAFASTAQLEAFLSDLVRRGRKRNTIVNYWTHMKGFFHWGDLAGYLDGDPTLTMKRPKTPKFSPKPLAPAQLEIALTRAPNPWHAVFALAYYEGLRAGEIAQCRREDITEENVYVPHGKGGEAAAVPTHPYIWALLSAWAPGPLFPNATPQRISHGAIRQFRRLGLIGVHVHRLRHSFATDMLIAGADLRVVQDNMRHASVVSTAAYTQVTSQRKRAAVVALHQPTRTPADL